MLASNLNRGKEKKILFCYQLCGNAINNCMTCLRLKSVQFMNQIISKN